MDLHELERIWRRESERSMSDAIKAGAPHNVVTEERMRWLVLQWVQQIEAARQEI